MTYIIYIIFFLIYIQTASSSAGDRSTFYYHCVDDCFKKTQCRRENAERGIFIKNGQLDIILWSCVENCENDCMWSTVEAFQKRGWPVPQFHGKWPFVRVFGLQEPASAIFSIQNLMVVIKGLSDFRKSVRPDSPYYWLWHFYSFMTMNCWVWSTVYHARDTDVTERLDYISASALVFTGFFCMSVRTLRLDLNIKAVVWAVVCAIVLLNHCAYLWFFPFDYAYNMSFNVIVGAFAVTGWLIWSAVAIKQNHPCPRSVAAYCLLLASAMLLELLDFPPWMWCVDAHALWHLITCFITPIFFDFIARDAVYLRTLQVKLPEKIQ